MLARLIGMPPRTCIILLSMLSFAWVSCLRFSVERPNNQVPGVKVAVPNSVRGGETVTLVAEGIDGDGDPLSYRWSQVSGWVVELSGDATPQLTFVAPLHRGTLVFSVVATDGIDTSTATLAQMEVEFNRPPVADAGDLYETMNRQSLWLQGGATDPDGDAMASWHWTVLDGPLNVPLDAILVEPEIRTPLFRSLVAGEYTVSLVVNDGIADSEPDTVRVIARNNAPEAVIDFIQDDPTRPIFKVSAASSHDVEGDAIVGYRWSVAEVPPGGTARFTAGDASSAEIEITLAGRGTYTIELIVSDGEESWSEPARVFLSGNSAPSLLLPSPQILATEGQAFAVSGASSADVDGDPVTVIWRRINGSDAFPMEMVGTSPAPVAPSLLPLLEQGNNSAVYEVTASDGLSSSWPQLATFYVLPAEVGFVVVGMGGTDESGCGAVSSPCATLRFGLQEAAASGRDIIMTTGTFAASTPTTSNAYVQVWPPGVSLFAGRSAETFAFEEHTVLEMKKTGSPGQASCLHYADVGGLHLPDTIGADVLLEGFLARVWTSSCSIGVLTSVRCVGCRARLRNAELVGAGGGYGSRGLVVAGSADLRAEGVVFRAVGGSRIRVAVAISGSEASLEDCVAHTAAIEHEFEDGRSRGVAVTGGARLQGNRLVIDFVGAVLNTEAASSGGLYVDASTATISNSFIRGLAGPKTPVVRHKGGGHLSLRHCTLVGPGNVGVVEDSDVGAIHLSSSASLLGNIITEAPVGIQFVNADAKGSLIYANAISAAAAGRCIDDLVDVDALNSPPETGCNGSSDTWSGNLGEPCPLRAAAEGDFRLNIDAANPCVDAGMNSSPAGTPPDDDIDGNARPLGPAPDIGAHEAQ